jgi:heme/copper-type cytochrome/quinol oxidase subunit 2
METLSVGIFVLPSLLDKAPKKWYIKENERGGHMAFLIIVMAIVLFVCTCVGISMVPFYRPTFSSMTQEEKERYWRGLIIVVTPLLICAVLVLCVIAPLL